MQKQRYFNMGTYSGTKPLEMSMICIYGMAGNNDSKKFNEIASNCNLT